ncbi:MAG TPA: tripartite tricarboxylate transporter substrate binding protein [Burkholderiales bacterium]|nr:tripartite tricarboxylate transporter substrate binding protein [Burkholderiales bacterium]
MDLGASRALPAAAAVLAIGIADAVAQTYPARPVRIIAASAPGGTSDILARLLAQQLTAELGQSFVVENRAGASGIIGTDVVAKAPPDGYTLLIIQPSLTINPHIFAKVPHDAVRDFAPISLVVDVPQVLNVHPSVPARSVRDLIALAKERPGRVTNGSPGQGTHPHLTSVRFEQATGIKLQQIVYKGVGPAFIGLVSGEVAMVFSAVSSAITHIKTGKIRAIGVTSGKRVPALPDVPTVAETLPGFESSQWFGMLAPAGTPRAIIDRLNQAIGHASRTPEVKQKFASMAMEPVNSTPDEFAKVIREESATWARVVKEAGITPQ